MPRTPRTPSGEDALLRWLRGQLSAQPGPSLLGDDAAILPAGGPSAVTVDSQVSGVHFVPDLDPAVLARRLLAVNLSDLAAMGARPAWGFLALSAEPDFDHPRFFRAFLAACRRHGVELAGGDLARHPGGTTATLTLIGGLPPGGRWVPRSGAEPGHRLWVGGTLGESGLGARLVGLGARVELGASGWGRGRVRLGPAAAAVGERPALLAAARRAVLRHLLPEPQLALGEWLGRQPAGAGMDLSDGLARDLPRLARESGAGAEVEAAALPLARGFRSLCERLGADPLALALGGGEDYALLFTLPPEVEPPEAFGCRRIGTITRQGLSLLEGGARRPLPGIGWDHLG